MTEEDRQRLTRLLAGMTQVGEGITVCVDRLGSLLNLAGELLTDAKKIVESDRQ